MPGDGEDVICRGHDRDSLTMSAAACKFTWRELSQLNQRHNAHVAVRGKVYDVSSFIAQHPGGADQIMLGAGRDITQLFESYHMFPPHQVLEKYYVGTLVDNELPVFPVQTDFYPTVKRRVHKYFRDNNIDPKFSYWMFLQYSTFFVLSLAFYCAMICFGDSLLLGLPVAIGWGWFTALTSMMVVHDSSHFSITHKPWVWRFLGHAAHDFLWGGSWYCWVYQHSIGHHPYPNIDRADPDVSTASEGMSEIRRIKWIQKWEPRFFFQHIYIYFLYCFLGVKIRTQDFMVMYKLWHSTVRLNPPGVRGWAIFLAGKCFHFTYRFIVPCFFLPWTRVLLLSAVAEVWMGFWLAVMSETNHVVEEVDWPQPDKDNIVHQDWAEMQIQTALDYATDSWFWNTFSTTLNHQSAHHLFPSVIQSHLPAITPIVREACREFGVRYNCVETGWQALASHANYMKKLGQTGELNTDSGTGDSEGNRQKED